MTADETLKRSAAVAAATEKGAKAEDTLDAGLHAAKKANKAGDAAATSTKAPGEASQLEQLKKMTVVVADTGDFNQIKAFNPHDATTNPTLLLQASQMDEYRHLLDQAVDDALKHQQKTKKKTKSAATRSSKAGSNGVVADAHNDAAHTNDNDDNDDDDGDNDDDEASLIDDVCDRLAAKFGLEILKIVPGVVSTEVPAALSFDTQKSIERARKIISIYESQGISRNRILIKMATTWESCEAAKVLEKERIQCNMTLLFCLAQAIAAAEAGATLISPFVGRILDWNLKNAPDEATKKSFVDDKDPGVISVKSIYNYYKKFGYKTIVMGASFRNTGEIIWLAGCDKLTISPKLLHDLDQEKKELKRQLFSTVNDDTINKIEICETSFRWMMNEDAMATEKLAEGIRNFHKDLCKLKDFVKTKLDERRAKA